MEDFNLFILIGLIIIIIYFLNKPKKQNKKSEKQIDTTNIYITNLKDPHDIIYKDNTDFYKKNFAKNNTDLEIKQINIDKGKITRNSNLNESGGSIHYNNIKINTNISGNKISLNEEQKTYRKLPTKIK